MLRVSIGMLFLMSASGAFAADYDLVVYGGTCSGVTAAVQAARMGKTVVLIEPTQHLGGLSSGGLGATDIGNKAAIGGISREFYKRLGKHYGQEEAWMFEPHAAENVFQDLIAEHKIPVVRGERLDLKDGVKKDGARILSIKMESGQTFAGKYFIDATYEGDLMAKAGVAYHVGREANAQYQETLNGVAVAHSKSHQFNKKVDPYVVPGDPKSGLIAGVQAGGPGEEGAGDKRVQAYNYRMCMTDVAENMIPWPKPANYDEKRFELLLRNVEAGDLRVPYNPVMMPKRKTDTNNNFAVSTDNIGMNYDYPDADYAAREKIVQEHKDYQMGLMWTLANHPRVHEELRNKVSKWGLAKDEFTDTGGWPRQLYVREARRMIGPYVMTQHDCQWKNVAEDSVGLGAYGMDSHNTQRYVTPEGTVRNEGDVQVRVAGPYPISYRSIVPKEAECSNLLVPVCLSATHIAYGSIRMEPVFMVLGQSAATAACQAIDAGVPSIQKLDYKKLRERLLADGQVLGWTGAARPAGTGVEVAKLPGIVIDDVKAELTGEWTRSSTTPGYVGEGYIHDGNTGKGAKSARFSATIEKAGTYEVRVSYTPLANRASNVPVTVGGHETGKGETTVRIDQTKPPKLEHGFISLGKFQFAEGAKATVTISNQDTDGNVIVDAVQILPAQ